MLMFRNRLTRTLGALLLAAAASAALAAPAVAVPVDPGPGPEDLTSEGVLLDAPDPGPKRYAPQTDLLRYPKGGGTAGQPAARAADPAELDAHHRDVLVEMPLADGVVQFELYSPAAGVSPEQLAERLRSQGRPARVVEHDEEDRPHGQDRPGHVVEHAEETRAAGNGVAVMAARRDPNACSYGTARFGGNTCPPPLHHTNNGYSDPQVRFNDHSGAAWPVSSAVPYWNQAVGIDSYYLYNQCPFQAGARCVDVFSADYGNVGWNGYTTWQRSSSGAFVENSIIVRLNDYAPENRLRTTRHELGHALGLGHSVTAVSVMWGTANAAVNATSDDFNYLAQLYSITR